MFFVRAIHAGPEGVVVGGREEGGGSSSVGVQGRGGWGPEGWEPKSSRFFFPHPPQISFFLLSQCNCGHGSRPPTQSARLEFSRSFCASAPAPQKSLRKSEILGGPGKGGQPRAVHPAEDSPPGGGAHKSTNKNHTE